MTREDIIKAIEEMSVLELSELVKELEDKFGVSAAAPAMMPFLPIQCMRMSDTGILIARARKPVFISTEVKPMPREMYVTPTDITCQKLVIQIIRNT